MAILYHCQDKSTVVVIQFDQYYCWLK